METKSIEKDGIDACLRAATGRLEDGLIVCYPTETFYALGARFDSEKALERISALKGRPVSKPFPLIIGRVDLLDLVASEVVPPARRIIGNLWPGPLTVVFSAKEGISPLIRGERNTVAVRIPGPSFALDLARSTTFPITATSANRAGAPPAKSAEEVRNCFPEGIDLLIEGGTSAAPLPSTIIEIRDRRVIMLREGMVPFSRISSALGQHE